MCKNGDLAQLLLKERAFCSGRESGPKRQPARAGHGRGGAPSRLDFPTTGLEAFRFALAMGEVVQRIGRLFAVYTPCPAARPSFSGMITEEVSSDPGKLGTGPSRPPFAPRTRRQEK